MSQIKRISILGIFVGFSVVVVTSVVLSLFSLVIFSDLLTGNDSLDVLTTALVPLVYSIVAIAVAVIVGIAVTATIAKRSSLANAVGVALLYGLFSYGLRQSPSNLGIYPQWFVVMSYAVLLPSAVLGHYISVKLVRAA